MEDTTSTDGMTRREALGRMGAAAATGMAVPTLGVFGEPATARQSKSPNEKLTMGLIGCGGMGASNMRSLMRYDDVEFVALCDVDENRIPGDLKEVEKKYKKAPKVYKDYRQMLERKDIDAVIVGTPDHWHALNFIHACEAGKDSYCEKPISHNIVEAVYMAEAARRHKRVVQVGTWQRSTQEFVDAINYVRTGKLGKVVLCRAWISDGARMGRQKATTPPKGLDYDFWVGPARFEPYQSNRCHWNWRWFMNYGGGMSTDWGVHMMDIALLGMSKGQNLVMPVSVQAQGGIWAIEDDDRTAPDVTEAIYRFKNPNFALHWAIGRDHPGKPGHGTEFVGADGRTVRVWRGGWQVLDPDGKELPKEAGPPAGDHWRDFVDCVKTRKTPQADIRSVAQTTIVCHLANVALLTGETVRWDQSKWDIVGSTGKATLAYQRPYRSPWTLPNYKPQIPG